jgi:putative tryptophan/tyrosine transport system substrate-binding protein
MKRREFLTIAGVAAVFAPLAGFAQETGQKQSGTAKLPGIGILSNAAGEASTPLIAGVFTELQRLGWLNGRSAIYEPRFSAGDPSRFPGFATDLVDRKVNVIFAASQVAAKAAQSATATIPIVALADDMEEAGLVTSIARTGNNITGVSIFGSELDEKRFELLVEMVPAARRMVVLAESKTRPSVTQVAANAHRLGIELVLIEAPSLDKLDSALDAVARAGVDAVNVLASAILYNGRRAIIDRMAASRLPAIYQWPKNVAEGALMGYGPTQALISRQLAELIDRVLKGVSPTELPVLRPTKFELAINLKTAKALGLTVPPSLLARADEVIE